jgi:hypothetical protein
LGGSLESVAKMVECISALSEDDLRDYSYFGKYCVLDLPGVDCNVIQITKQFLKSLNIPRFPKQLELGYVHSKVSVAIGKMLHRDIMESQERETRGRKRGSSQSSDS